MSDSDSKLRGPDDWRVGDKAYIYDRFESSPYSLGDIFTITDPRPDGLLVCGGYVSVERDCALRVLVPGDVLPKGARYLRIAGQCDGEIMVNGYPCELDDVYTNMFALVSLPEPDPDPNVVEREQLIKRLEQAEEEIRIVKEALND